MAKLNSIIFLFFVCYLTVFTLCLVQGHSHDDHGHAHDHHGHAHDHHGHAHGQHGHDEPEPASFRYSKEANEQKEAEDLSLNKHDHHGHSHGEHDDAHSHDHAHSHDDGHSHDEHKSESTKSGDANKMSKKDTGLWLWAQALSATAIISVAPVFILICIPIANAAEHQEFLKVLLSFASGGLLGDAFLHLIPHAISPHSHGGDGEEDHHQHIHESHDHGHSHEHGGHNLSVGLWVLGGIIAFLIVEKCVRMVKGEHGHSHGVKAVSNKSTPSTSKSTDNTTKSKKDKTSDDEDNKTKTKKGDKSSKKPVKPTPEEDIKVAGYLNLAADFAHNFTDGLAIGASFLMGRNIGIITAVTIFLHEIPHEIGDFAILIQSGCSKKKAMLLQFSTAIGAMLGTVSSLLAEGADAAATAWILPFTAGGFIYIATVSVIPELLEDSKLWQSVKEIVALLVGVYMMVLIAAYE